MVRWSRGALLTLEEARQLAIDKYAPLVTFLQQRVQALEADRVPTSVPPPPPVVAYTGPNRAEQIEALVQAALSGMEPLSASSSGSEVLNAYFTIAKRAVSTARAMGVNMDLVADMVADIWRDAQQGRPVERVS